MKRLLATAFALLIVTGAIACRCARVSVREAFNYSSYVVRVQVVAVADTVQYTDLARKDPSPERPPFKYGYLPVLKIVKTYKGVLPAQITLSAVGSMCDPYFTVGREAILFLYKLPDGRIVADECAPRVRFSGELKGKDRKPLEELEKLASAAKS